MKLFKSKWLTPLPMLTLFTIGLSRVSSFGISWDEYEQRAIGTYNLIQIIRYINPKLVPQRFSYFPTLDNLSNGGYQTHGAWFEMILAISERLLGLESDKSIFLMRHGLTYTFVFFGIVNLTLFLKDLTKSNFSTLISISMLIFSPRLFADAFYNSKDMIFFAMICIGLNVARLYFANQSQRNFILLAFVTGMTAGVRLAGIILILILTLIIIIKPPVSAKDRIRKIAAILFFSLMSGITLIISMPYLWRNPFVRLVDIATRNTKFEWNGLVLFNGSSISAKHLPWTYLPTWICITTPLIYLLCGMLGLIIFTRITIEKYIDKTYVFKPAQISLLAYLVFGFLCFFAVVIEKSVLYDGWRHFYFIYPLLICLSALWIKFVLEKIFSKAIFKVFAILIFSQIVLVSSWMVRNFPMTNLYFNPLVTGQPALKWEMDYWGLGNLNAIRWLLNEANLERFSIAAYSSTPLVQSSKFLSDSELSRLTFTTFSERPDFLVNNFRGIRNPEIGQRIFGYQLIKTFKVDDSVYLQIYKKIT